MERRNIVIVGAGPAGVAAAVQCQRLGVAPVCIDRAGRAGGLAENAHRIENYPGLPHPVAGTELAGFLRGNLERCGLSLEKIDVTRIRHEETGFSVEGDGGILRARAVILATGTEPNRIELAGADDLENESIFYEVRSLIRRHPRPRRVVVIGGGEAACDYALTLAGIGAEVTLVVRSSNMRARGALADDVRRSPDVDVRCGSLCVAVTRRQPFTVRLRESVSPERIERQADALLVAVGRRSAARRILGRPEPPAVERAPDLPPGLFIAGDARFGSLGQVGMAVGDGLRAATAAVAFLEGG